MRHELGACSIDKAAGDTLNLATTIMNSESSHNQVNLARLLRRLEKAVQNQDWNYQSLTESSATWIRAEGMLQYRVGSTPLHNMTFGYRNPRSEYWQATESKIAALESVLNDVRSVSNRVNFYLPKPKAPSYLSHVPPPRPKLTLQPTVTITADEIKSPEEITSQALLPVEERELEPRSPQSALLPTTAFPDFGGKHTRAEPSDSLLPPRPQHSSSNSPTTDLPAFMQTSLQTQEDLSEQLALMAAQLKRNAQTFAAQLHEDNTLVQLAHDQLEGVHTRVKTERSTLRAFSAKSGYTTWMTIGIIIVVIISWVSMFLMIKIT
ncbi:Use1 domain-containing protein [Rhizoctonia solani AG-1 IA]|uniref:Use1 domain-containing protein n=1 Tax=Thanatephorus cucumeris (strain AG1-IA) TaxID=983506 RepID=L8X287_THACA|nr:Use1 domain-containing protein [Rhizoctonia solani AG-1 IA]